MSSSAAAAPAATPLDHVTVGTTFVDQYYKVLHKNPKYLYRFFHAGSSSFSHQNALQGPECKLQVGQPEEVLKKCIETLYVGDFSVHVDVSAVNTQPSAQGGVLVLVTGKLVVQFPDMAVPRQFAQTFFLAPQPGGFFVLNDILRYTAQMPAPPSVPMPMPPVPLPMPAPGPPTPPMMENGETNPPPASAAARAPPPPAPLPGWAQPQAAQPPPPFKPPPAPEAPPVPAPPEMSQKVVEEPPAVKEEPAPVQETAPPPKSKLEPTPVQEDPDMPSAPLTYAQRLKLSAAKQKPASQAPPVAEPPASEAAPEGPGAETAAAPSPAAASAAAPPALAVAAAAGSRPSGAEPGSSVFVRFLPTTVDESALAQEFSRFGTLLPSQQYPKGINLKNQGNKSYAFVDFTTLEAATAVIQAGIVIDGRTITVEEKRPSIMRPGRGGGRDGRRDGGRGGVPRRDSGRGYGRDNRMQSGGRGSMGGGDRQGGRGAQRY